MQPKYVTADALNAQLAVLLAADTQYQEAKIELKEVRATLYSLTATVRQFVYVARDAVKPFLGNRYSTKWQALWQDGAVLFRQDGKLFTGTIDPESFRTLWETLRAAKFFTTAREHYVVPDSSYETIMVRLRNESAIHSWHGVLRPGFGGNIETDAEYRAFVGMWKTSEAAIHSITPDDVRPVEQRASDGNFRGYIVDEPSKTDWLNVRAWKHQIE